MKYEWRKEEKQFYLNKGVPVVVEVPKFKYITINGRGNPNEKDFSVRVETLYSIAYAIRMMPKSGYVPDGYFEYTVYPLEGIWDLSEDGRKEDKLNKDELVYKIMLRQPSFVTDAVYEKALDIVKKKKKDLLSSEVNFEELEDGLCVQMLHVGSYDNEKETFNVMNDFMISNNLGRKSLVHKEIYLSDPRKVSNDKLQTILRIFVK